MTPGFAFLDQGYYDQLQMVTWLDKDGRESTPKLEDQSASDKVCKVRILKGIEPLDSAKFPIETVDQPGSSVSLLSQNEQLALAKIAKADSPFMPPIVRQDEPNELEAPSTKIVGLCAESLNAGTLEGALDMIRTVMLQCCNFLHSGFEQGAAYRSSDGSH